jgi:hypothetical protein
VFFNQSGSFDVRYYCVRESNMLKNFKILARKMFDSMPVIISILILCVMTYGTACACPACKDGFSSNSSQAAIGETYSWTILFLLAVPITASAVIVWKIRASIKAKQGLISLDQGQQISL